jgi:hypothetical protein
MVLNIKGPLLHRIVYMIYHHHHHHHHHDVHTGGLGVLPVP